MKMEFPLRPPSLVGPAGMEVGDFVDAMGVSSSCLDVVRPIPSSAGLTMSPVVSEAGLPIQTPSVDTYSSSPHFGDIQQWLAAAPQGNSSTLFHAVNPPSPASSANTAWSELTADAGESVANSEVDSAYHGDWMSLPFSRRAAAFKLAE